MADQSYNVFENAKIINIPAFTQDPPCTYFVDYTIELISPTPGPLPGFISVSGERELTVET